MNVNQIDTKKSSCIRDVNSEHTYEDDGFFSDVPASGSLTKSLSALNKYVKKNLFYEDYESDSDAAYFSKESTPNKSEIKYLSDSVQNSNPRENEEVVKAPTNKATYVEVTQVIKPIHEIPIASVVTTNNISLASLTPIKENKPSKESVNNIPYASEQTDDYKFKQLRDNPNTRNSIVKKSAASIDYTDIDNPIEPNNLQAENKSASLQDLTNDYGTSADTDNSQAENVVHRHKKHVTIKENRHTVHDASDWVNRTDMYPDVYAPLPYKSPRRYVESDVNIHYRCPVRHDPLPLVPERELARQQAEHMKRLYREQRRNKYLQELQDMQNRRHQDNFTPSQKNILPLNRYDEAEKVVAKALYTFNGQTTRELSFRKGEIIHVRRQVDANWYEGELHGRVGLFPYNYVEIQKGENPQPQKKPVALEGRARAKFDFTAQTNLELPLKKGEIVVLTRRIDQNWWEGRNGNKTGIFPDSYVTILQEPSQNKPDPQLIMNHSNSHDKPVASPAAHSLMNGSAKRSIGPHSYTPQHNSPALSNAPPATQPLPGYASKPAQALLTPSERGYGPPTGQGVDLNNSEPLYVDTNAEAIPYRAMYKYRPQNPDELELNEGDTVYVLEKCDDGWYVGSSQRTGRFGTFPGNYVERI